MSEINTTATPTVKGQFDIATFQKAQQKMIATNDNAYRRNFTRQRVKPTKDYTEEEIREIVSSGAVIEQQRLSRNYFYRDGYYKQILTHYATLLKYAGILIPNPGYGKSLSTSHIQKKYYAAVDYVDKMNLPVFLTNCALRALIDGCYYGVITQLDKNNFSVIDLPHEFCTSRFKDVAGNDIIEFDLEYFQKISYLKAREAALRAYPDFISKAYRKWVTNKHMSAEDKWVVIPSEIGVCFPFFDGRPPMLNVIPATIEYEKALATEQERNLEEIRKIIVQKIPHLTDGRLLFEPDEAQEIHDGTVGMLKGNKNISVLTTYADVDSIASNTTTDGQTTLERMLQNIYSQAGVSSQLFASTGSNTLSSSIKNDIAFMMYIANKFSNFITFAINSVHSNANIKFRYEILPISYYNDEEYAKTCFTLASSGYSLLLPAIAMGISQKDLGNMKDLENDVLDLGNKLRPLTSAFTQSGDSAEAGRPKMEDDEKSDKTVQNEESLEKTAGGSEN